ncbi:hypothetical protein [Photobacterium sp. J15]|uniref:hypothetical protein n=1 Tax=Photobacterium sp. J15 TaxID=265901 RepID=UPI0007E34E3F|nr:hypothetical protein [Photobacterium sp. J15]
MNELSSSQILDAIDKFACDIQSDLDAIFSSSVIKAVVSLYYQHEEVHGEKVSEESCNRES